MTSATFPLPIDPPPVAVTRTLVWRYFRHGYASIPGGLLVLCALPALLYLLLRTAHPGTAEALRQDPSHLRWVFFAVELLGYPMMALLEAARVRPLYPLPISSRRIANTQLVLAITAVTVMHFATVAFYAALFDAQIPLFGPLLYLLPATLFGAGLIVLWTDFRWWRPWVVLASFVLLIVWWRTTKFSEPDVLQHMTAWYTPDWREIPVLVALSVIGYSLAVEGVRRDRCGELRDWPDLDALLKRFLVWTASHWSRLPRSARLDSPASAQFAYEWSSLGISVPIAAAAFALLAVATGIFSPSPTAWLASLAAAVPVLLVLGGVIAGLIGGVVMTSDANWEMHAYRSTRPLSDAQLAVAVLKSGVTGILAAVGVLLLAVIAVIAGSQFTAPVDAGSVFSQLARAYTPRTGPGDGASAAARFVLAYAGGVLGCWSALGITSSLLLTGRRWVLSAASLAAFGLPIAAIVLTRWEEATGREPLAGSVLLATLAGVALIGGGWIFVQTLRKKLLRPRAALIGAGLWVLISGATLAGWSTLQPLEPLAALVLIAGSALCVTPVASATLAVWWNRHR